MPSKNRCTSSDSGVSTSPRLQASKPVARTHRDRDRHDPLLLERQELRAREFALPRLHHVSDLLVRESLETVQAAAELDVRHRLDVEREDVADRLMPRASARRISTATATRGRPRR